MAKISLLYLSLSAFLIAHVKSDLYSCGSAFYDPTKYTCFTGNFLCPIIGGQDYFPCSGACYSPASYSCANGQLAPPITSNTFTVTVSWPFTSDDQRPLEASGLGFIFGPGINSSAAYCPVSVGSACPVSTATVFTAGGGAMSVEVPGGQQVYVAPDGALSYTQAHSASYPPGSQFGGFGGSGGEFIFTGPNGTTGWIACPVDTKNFSPPLENVYKIYANIPSHPTRYPNNSPLFVCSNVTLLLDAWTGGFGAWQYT